MTDADPDPPEPLLTPEQASEWLSIPVGTLRQWRSLGRGPVYVKVGHFVRYKAADLAKFIEDNTHRPE